MEPELIDVDIGSLGMHFGQKPCLVAILLVQVGRVDHTIVN